MRDGHRSCGTDYALDIHGSCGADYAVIEAIDGHGCATPARGPSPKGAAVSMIVLILVTVPGLGFEPLGPVLGFRVYGLEFRV